MQVLSWNRHKIDIIRTSPPLNTSDSCPVENHKKEERWKPGNTWSISGMYEHHSPHFSCEKCFPFFILKENPFLEICFWAILMHELFLVGNSSFLDKLWKRTNWSNTGNFLKVEAKPEPEIDARLPSRLEEASQAPSRPSVLRCRNSRRLRRDPMVKIFRMLMGVFLLPTLEGRLQRWALRAQDENKRRRRFCLAAARTTSLSFKQSGQTPTRARSGWK